MTRRSFPSSETTIVVSTDGYFDVYPPVPRSDGDKPVYRGRLNELGAGSAALTIDSPFAPPPWRLRTPSPCGRPSTARPPCGARWAPAATGTKPRPDPQDGWYRPQPWDSASDS